MGSTAGKTSLEKVAHSGPVFSCRHCHDTNEIKEVLNIASPIHALAFYTNSKA